MEEPDPPTPPESAPAPPPAPVPAAAPAPPLQVLAMAQQKKRGRPPATWLQIEEKKLKRMEAVYLSAERDRVAKIDEHDQNRTYGHTLHWPEPQMPPESLEKRFQEKMMKRQRKANELESAWLQAVEEFEAEKLRRVVDLGGPWTYAGHGVDDPSLGAQVATAQDQVRAG